MEILQDAGVFGFVVLALFVAGLGLTSTWARQHNRVSSVAATFSVAILAVANLGAHLAQRVVEQHVAQMPADDVAKLAQKIEVLNIGTREASSNLLIGGACAVLLIAIGAAIRYVDRQEG